MSGALRDDLASLKIDRRGGVVSRPGRSTEPRPGRDAGGFFMALSSTLLWLVPLGLVGGAGYYGYLEYKKIQAKPEVQVGQVQTMTSGEAEKLLSAKGYLKSRNQSLIGAKIPGRVESIFVEEGSKVKKGDVLAILEHSDFKAARDMKLAQVAKVTAELVGAKLDLAEKDRKSQRAERLYAKGTSTSVEEVDTARTAREIASAKLGEIEAQIKLMQASVAETEDSIRNMKLIAPFDGTVVEKQGEVGEVITTMAMSASTGRSAVVTLANLEKMEVETDIAESLLSRIAIGQPAEVSVSAVPGRYYRGRLRQIIPMGDRARGTVKVKVEILDPDEKLFPELVATVHFLPDKSVNNPDAGKALLFVPKAAIFEEAGHSNVWVVNAKNQLLHRRVEVVVTKDDLARVETGLTAGESVVLSPAKSLREGDEVKLPQ